MPFAQNYSNDRGAEEKSGRKGKWQVGCPDWTRKKNGIDICKHEAHEPIYQGNQLFCMKNCLVGCNSVFLLLHKLGNDESA
jgi:hypothetical protein